jgi:L-alanine-DL-glutamate epimerase-like enolase superfamily enzyme
MSFSPFYWAADMPEQTLKISAHIEEWATRTPFRIAGLSRDAFRSVVVEITDGRITGRGEGLPIRYLHETPESIVAVISDLAAASVSAEELCTLLGPGGARSAVDAAVWDLTAKRSGLSVWERIGVTPSPLATVCTIGLEDEPSQMAARALELSDFNLLKIKVDTDRPVDRVAKIRAARPDATLFVDANQAWNFEQLVVVAPQLQALGVELIEQPLARGADDCLEAYSCPIPLMADESCQHEGELEAAALRYQAINIKLDKVGGLTAALSMGKAVTQAGLKLWVGNMGGTSLAMAPAFVLAQMADHVELDGPLLLRHDRPHGSICTKGQLLPPDPRLWG